MKGGSELLAALKTHTHTQLLFLLNNKPGFFFKRCGIFGTQSRKAKYKEPHTLEMQSEDLRALGCLAKRFVAKSPL